MHEHDAVELGVGVVRDWLGRRGGGLFGAGAGQGAQAEGEQQGGQNSH
jgi:hypothetical protein